MWVFRPSAFEQNYKSISIATLRKFYDQDNKSAQKDEVEVPAYEPSSSGLRTCQWNVHYFAPIDSINNANDLALAIAETVLETEADVIVLNEFGYAQPGTWSANRATQRLESEGYTVHCADCMFRTAIATRLPVKASTTSALDANRAAVAVQVELRDGKGSVWIYGTHLEDSDDNGGQDRANEIKTLLRKGHLQGETGQDRILIVGDFNQQRQQDYTQARNGKPFVPTSSFEIHQPMMESLRS